MSYQNGNVAIMDYTKEELDEIIETATVDAYGYDEELESWNAYLGEELAFPLPVVVMGVPADAQAIDIRDGVAKFRVISKNKEYWISVIDAELVNDQGEHDHDDLLLHAFRAWDVPCEG